MSFKSSLFLYGVKLDVPMDRPLNHLTLDLPQLPTNRLHPRLNHRLLLLHAKTFKLQPTHSLNKIVLHKIREINQILLIIKHCPMGTLLICFLIAPHLLLTSLLLLPFPFPLSLPSFFSILQVVTSTSP
jgi:hypothetical protein